VSINYTTQGSSGRRRLQPDARRREILRAATRAFTTRPYNEIQIDAIARAAGASRALVHHYFADKRGLFLAVARDIVARTPAVVRTDLELGVAEMVAANTEAWLDLLEANPETALIFMGAGPPGHDPELDRLQDELRDGLAERMLANHLGEGKITPAARLTMRAATGLMQQAVRDWLSGRAPSRELTETLIVQTILAVVREVMPAVLAVEAETGSDPAP
jgi:AcrR family transcriptional regulator